MIPVRQSTAFECSIGPVLDADGVAVTGGVVGDFKIKKTTGNFAALNASATLTHVSAGTYDLVLTTSDTDTVGLASIAIDDTTNACAPLYLQVMEEVIYDALYAASANAFTGAAGAMKVSVVALVDLATTTTTATNVTTVNGLAANVITATSIASDAITAAKIATGAITAAKFAAGAIDAAAIADNAIDTATFAAGTTIPRCTLTDTLTTYTGNTVQTGDSYAIVNSGTHGNAAIKGFVDDIGTAGAGLTAVPWNAAWDAEVQSEVDDALIAKGLDHLVFTSVVGADIADNSIIAYLASKSATADWDSYANTTDSLEANRDNIGTAGAGLTAADDAVISAIAALSIPTVVQIRTEMDSNSTQLAAIVADTNELQTDWVNGGRLDLIIDATLADTDSLDTTKITTARAAILTDWIDGGRLDVILDARASQTSVDDVPTNAELATSQAAADDATLAAIAALNNLSAAQVNAEVLDVLNVDTFTEPGQEAPAATTTIRKMMAYLFKAWRNKSTETATQYSLYADDGTTLDQKSTNSDDGTTFNSGEVGSGP